MAENPFDKLAASGSFLTADLRAWILSPNVFKKLHQIHPELQNHVIQIVVAMAVLGHRMLVTDGIRTLAEQAALYAQGRTMMGPIVTNIDGVTRRSNHQAKPPESRYAGFGTAVDITFCDAAGKPSWDASWPWALYGAMAKARGLVWGGDWPRLVDRPHVELYE